MKPKTNTAKVCVGGNTLLRIGLHSEVNKLQVNSNYAQTQPSASTVQTPHSSHQYTIISRKQFTPYIQTKILNFGLNPV